MDNRVIMAVSKDHEDIDFLLKVIWKNVPGGNASHYKITKLKEVVHYCGNPATAHYTNLEEVEDGKDSLILYWHSDQNNLPLPFPYNIEEASAFIKSWLNKIKYPTKPDIDGSSEKGFKIFTDPIWGFAGNSHYGIIVVQPHWAMYGK